MPVHNKLDIIDCIVRLDDVLKVIDHYQPLSQSPTTATVNEEGEEKGMKVGWGGWGMGGQFLWNS